MNNTLKIKWEYEDELEIEEITEGMFKASMVDGVRMYPYITINNEKYYLESNSIMINYEDTKMNNWKYECYADNCDGIKEYEKMKN